MSFVKTVRFSAMNATADNHFAHTLTESPTFDSLDELTSYTQPTRRRRNSEDAELRIFAVPFVGTSQA